MGLQSMMFNGVSGLNRMSNNMSTLSDNVANVNTTSFKETMNAFQDAVPSTVAGLGDIGHGSLDYSLNKSFAQGDLESTDRATDMAISGKGFFILRTPKESTAALYTRDGQFRAASSSGGADAALHLLNQTGCYVQGINLGSTATPSGKVEDIVIQRASLPKSTENVTMALNIQDDPGTLETTDSPLYSQWDGTKFSDGKSAPIDDSAYDYKNTIKIYDGNGDANPYDLNIYFDGTTNSSEKEFLVTCDPTLDRRVIDASGARYNDAGVPTNAGAGALLYGKLSFSPSGELNDISCWNVPPDGKLVPTDANRIQLGRGDGYYSFDFNFSGTGDNHTSTLSFGTTPSPQTLTSDGAAVVMTNGDSTPLISERTTWDKVADSNGNKVAAGDVLTFTGSNGDGNPVTVQYTVDTANTVGDLLSTLGEQFGCDVSLTADGHLQLADQTMGGSQLAITSVSYRDAAGNDATANPALAQLFGDEGSSFATTVNAFSNPATISTTSYATASQTLYQNQDGYGVGYLQDVSVDKDGVLNGTYSNGQKIAQAQLVLADFINENGLYAAEGNAYRANNHAGAMTTDTPGKSSLGSISGNSLEMSNVNLTTQFVQLISTQRVFQANSSSIKTADEIYQKILAMI